MIGREVLPDDLKIPPFPGNSECSNFLLAGCFKDYEVALASLVACGSSVLIEGAIKNPQSIEDSSKGVPESFSSVGSESFYCSPNNGIRCHKNGLVWMHFHCKHVSPQAYAICGHQIVICVPEVDGALPRSVSRDLLKDKHCFLFVSDRKPTRPEVGTAGRWQKDYVLLLSPGRKINRYKMIFWVIWLQLFRKKFMLMFLNFFNSKFLK
jgi:hypothetical protein